MDRLAERDAVRQGNDVWFYNSKDNTASHVKLPADGRKPPPTTARRDPRPPRRSSPPGCWPRSTRSTDVTVGDDVQVAGRAAYNLMLTPRSEGTLVESVAIAVDGQNGLPLGVEVQGTRTGRACFRVAFTSLTLGAPDAGLFNFTPPPGATVKEIPALPERTRPAKDWANATPPAAKDATRKPRRHRLRLGLVVEFPCGNGRSGVATAEGPLLDRPRPVRAAGLLSTSLVNVLLLDDGRVFAGSVPLERLQAAAAR